MAEVDSSQKSIGSNRELLALSLSRFVTQPLSIISGLLLVDIASSFNSPVGVIGQVRTSAAIAEMVFALMIGALAIRFNQKNLRARDDDYIRDSSDIDLYSSTLSVNTYFEGIGVLIRRGLLSPEMVSDLLSGPIVIWWNHQAEFLKEYRVRTNWPQACEGMEYLYDEVMKVRSAGYAPDLQSVSKSQEQ